LDLLWLAETRDTDHGVTQHLFRTHDFVYIPVLRPTAGTATGAHAQVGGGGGFVVRKGGADVVTEAINHKGALYVSARPRGGEPFAAIGVYLPPTSASRRDWRDELLLWTVNEYRRLQRTHRIVVVLGDFNCRLGTAGAAGIAERFTADAAIPQSAVAGSRLLREFCDLVRVYPAHGRTAGTVAQPSSIAASGAGAATEVDYVLVPAALPLTAFRPLPPQSWHTRPARGAHVHLLVAAELDLLPRAAARPEPRPQRQRRYHLPPYGAEAWARTAAAIEAGLGAWRAQHAAGATAAAEAYRDLLGVFHAAAAAHLTNPSQALRSTVFRRYRGGAVSPQVAALLDEARTLRKRARAAARHTPLGVVCDAARELYAQATAVQRQACVLADEQAARWAADTVRGMAQLRTRDPHPLYRLLTTLSPADPNTFAASQRIPDRDGVPAAERFHDAFRQLIREDRPPPPAAAADSDWWRYVPAAPAGAGACLARPVTADEVYLLLFPANKRVLPAPCDARCVQCREYAEDHRRWRGGDAPDPPIWLPHLRTSTACGADGLPAEVLRWARPEVWADRLAYRRRVAGALAAVFNRILVEGQPPDAEFVRSVITPVLKSAKPGQPVDAGDPDAYRGIAVGNTVSKLFSLLLVARILHWAGVHGLIGPEQVGFLWRHAAEHHVFTLVQTLKARLRAGLPTYVLFVDLRKAYDKVHLTLLWAMLRHMGVAETVVAALANLAAVRETQVRINGGVCRHSPSRRASPRATRCRAYCLSCSSSRCRASWRRTCPAYAPSAC
jgi:hypothetical protein